MTRPGTGAPVDPALLREFPLLRGFLVARTASAIAGAAVVIAQAVGIAAVLGTVVTGGPAAALRSGWLVALAVVLVARVALSWWDRRHVESVAALWKRQLRDRAAAGLVARTLPRQNADTGAAVTLLTKGVDAVDAYLTGVLAVLPAAVVVPVGVVTAVLVLDWPSGLMLLATLPVVPLLLALVGQYTKTRTEHQWTSLLRLGNQFFEAVSGLVTLRVLGRAGRTSLRVREVADAHRRATVATLRVAFLSSFVLETLTSLAVALVAVPVGFRLLDGVLTLPVGLAVLMLTPELYRPLRSLGASFHAGQDARAMLAEMGRLFHPSGQEVPVVAARVASAPDPGRAPLELRDVAVGFDRDVLTGVTMLLRPGASYGVVGVSGAGKSTLLRTVAGLLPPRGGRILVGDIDLAIVDRADWTSRIAMVPQRPHMFTGTVADNVRIGARDASRAQVWHALEQAGAADFVRELSGGLDSPIGERGVRLSSGERQRIALARALVRRPALLLLDEPTARLDGETERGVLDALDAVSRTATVLVVTHRPQVVDRVDEVITVADGRARLMAVAR